MTLSAGTRLGPYEIVAPIGAGGMGEVLCVPHETPNSLDLVGLLVQRYLAGPC